MAYFVKKTNNKKGTYLQIYLNYYNPERGMACHKSYKAIGYVHELQAAGIEDPIAIAQEEVDKLNFEYREKRNKDKIKRISDKTPLKHLGYFPIKKLNDSLNVCEDINLLHSLTNQQFNLYNMLSSLIYARMVEPCSKLHTFEKVLPTLFEAQDFTLNQIYTGLDFIGSEYEKIIEIYNNALQRIYKFNTDISYFDCTNFYFEIDHEDLFRRKGPSKENRKDPIVGLGLLLDGNQIPMGMKLFPGNVSKKGILKEVIDNMKSRLHLEGRTVRVADKGLNCADNIFDAISYGDGYLFSKSVKTLPEKEKVWIKLDSGWTDVLDSEGKLKYRYKCIIDDFDYKITVNRKKIATTITEKRVLTFNPSLKEKQIAEINKQVDKAANLCVSKAKKSELGDYSKFVTFTAVDEDGKVSDDKIAVDINEEAVRKAKELAGYNLLVTSELNMSATEIYDLYHKLWRIEESFRVMKSELDARPVFLQKETSICGHFLICYLSVLLFRLFQIHLLEDKYGSQTLMEFIKNFNVVESSKYKYINQTLSSPFILEFAKATDLPIDHYYLKLSEINKMLGVK